jgi:DNA-nicking Smr family endonuclease
MMSDKKISPEDKALFRQAMAGVKPIKNTEKRDDKPLKFPSQGEKLVPIDPTYPENKDNARFLSDAINEPVFDHTTLSYQQNPLPLKRIKQLKSGTIAFQSQLDLHGFRGDEAKAALLTYLKKVRLAGIRCVLIIHGKGSYGAEPPRIKNLVNVWLQQLPEVLAFHSAIPKDGGTGALYVLLKR